MYRNLDIGFSWSAILRTTCKQTSLVTVSSDKMDLNVSLPLSMFTTHVPKENHIIFRESFIRILDSDVFEVN